MASIKRNGDDNRELSGPLFDTDPLMLAEEILDLKDTSTIDIDYDLVRAHKLADRLIMLDIAKSLRLLCDAPGIQSVHAKYGDRHARTIRVPHRPIEFNP